MAKVKQLLKTVTQLCIIYGITMLGNQIQQFFNIPLA
ncbi:CidA/LrgA family protein, partial [Staphylococcus pseudintermedius]|nr:CidA/LrgA family protein [Staphylococcus pseudintermedius]